MFILIDSWVAVGGRGIDLEAALMRPARQEPWGDSDTTDGAWSVVAIAPQKEVEPRGVTVDLELTVCLKLDDRETRRDLLEDASVSGLFSVALSESGCSCGVSLEVVFLTGLRDLLPVQVSVDFQK